MRDKLIKRIRSCKYCPFEDILTEDQRMKSVLDKPIPSPHIHRETIEQICGKGYDGVCKMKYAVERVAVDDRFVIQNACVGVYRWDLDKKYKRKFSFHESFVEWTREKDLGGGKPESYAIRFREIWDIGLRGKKQVISAAEIYAASVSGHETYEAGKKFYGLLRDEFFERYQNGIEQ